ncbi:hypothetical protein EWS92_21890 [Vibrio vulnificus]|uniref:hypothetical protein n=1 Tax=Vibrio vulnificus TaxID=672 RepID=UPI0018DB835E|nr:hypothetical protein [Vibrio vulnificus]EGR0791131.1 hypothetical protein [Vibrio vulnificus]EGR0799644.1 hypothetical protein [Vibrio vulnificus]EGR0829209.1 hypothetical protein [Vibrio vulnificus]EGR0849697.1 hypothetical protein [Vibrio vulnificus]EGR0854225.1 hypothetical protein [Vibrio vulnificus]
MSQEIDFCSNDAKEFFYEITVQSAVGYIAALSESHVIESLVFKTHLWLERMFDEIIAMHFPNPKAIEKGRFSFSQKLILVRAIKGTSDSDLELFSKIHTLNQIRNEIAHYIYSEKLANLFKKLGIEYAESLLKESEKELADTIRLKFSEVYGQVVAIKVMQEYDEQGYKFVATES